jgi:outer membrane receptor for ferric coprogen and ferric-rhodotorulic acid
MPSVTSRMTRNIFSTAVTLALGSAAIPSQAMAQSTAAAISGQVTLNIPAQPLKSALRAFAGATHLQLVYTSDLVAGLGSGGVSGSYAPAAALQQLLAGSGLVSRFTSPGVVTLEKLSADGAKVIGTVEVEGAKTAGVNGSTDPTATEGSGSYTTDAMSIGSKTAQSIRETPQSVSVITKQQMQDQNITTLVDALKETPGITVTTNTYGNSVFYSRGYEITNFMIDGSPTGADPFGNTFANPGRNVPLAMYDHVEVLRGPDGMFAGNGDPGGTVNLTRKKPLDHTQVIFEGAAGSWSNDRGMLDVSAPVPGTDGKIRTRFVIEDKTQDYFYRLAFGSSLTAYGQVEVDLTSSTMLSFGSSYTKQDDVPWVQGLPRKNDGSDLQLPRNTSYALPWNRAKSESKEEFASLRQKLGEDWNLKLNTTHKEAMSDSIYGYLGAASPGIFPGQLKSAGVSYVDIQYPTESLSADATLSGKFQLFGRSHTVMVGADMQRMSETGYNQFSTSGAATTYLTYDQFMNFNPALYPKPSFYRSMYYNLGEQNQYGAYTTVKLALLDSLHLTGGVRDSGYQYDTNTSTYSKTGAQVATANTAYSKHGAVTPYGGLVYDLTKEWSAYSSYTSIFKTQFEFDKYGAPLPPITGASYESGIKAELLNNKLKLSVAYFSSERYNVGVQDSSVTYTVLGGAAYLPAGKSTSKGIDSEISGELLPGLQVHGSYVFNKTNTEVGVASTIGQPLITLAPAHMVKFFTTYQLSGDYNKWTVGGGFNWQSATYTSGSLCPGNVTAASTCVNDNGKTLAYTPYNFTNPARAIFNAILAYQYDKNWKVQLNVNNIFDKVYYETVGGVTNGNWYGAPRNATLTVRGSW